MKLINQDNHLVD